MLFPRIAVKLAALPIVVITTEGEEAHRARALATGATDYVTKPIQSVAVVTVVRKILGIEAG